MFWEDEDEVTGFHTGFVNLFNSSKEVSFSPPVIRTSSVSLISQRSWVIRRQLKVQLLKWPQLMTVLSDF